LGFTIVIDGQTGNEVFDLNEVKLTARQQQMIDAFTIALPRLRKELNVSQTVLGEKIGISRQMISFIERGIHPMSWSTFLSIALFFKVNYGRDKSGLTDLDKFLLVNIEDE
jgi:DNA-binding XRE family transcriptional regulator